jgi:hypothetical protein
MDRVVVSCLFSPPIDRLVSPVSYLLAQRKIFDFCRNSNDSEFPHLRGAVKLPLIAGYRRLN